MNQAASGRHEDRDENLGSRHIAATLLEALALRGRLADREAALRSLRSHGAPERGASVDGEDGIDAGLIDAPRWLPPDAVACMFAAGSVDVPVARALGQRLLAPESIGMPLYLLGLATPEKAYRRVQALLPREAMLAKWMTEEVADEAATLSYRPHPACRESPASILQEFTQASRCALRRGMLESIPTFYGLLPATLEETQCVVRGDSVCRYRVRWSRTARRGLRTGAVVGAILGLGTIGWSALWATGLTLSVGLAAAVLIFALAIVLGQCADFATQLAAIGAARRGQLALFEQVDDQLASKLDALARVDAKIDQEPTMFQIGLRRSHIEEVEGDSRAEGAGAFDDARRSERPHGSDVGDSHSLGEGSEVSERERGILSAAQAIHAAAGDLECAFDAASVGSSQEMSALNEVGEERGKIREIRDWALRIVNDVAPDSRIRRSVDLEALVARGIASVRPLLPDSSVIRVEVEPDLEPVRCEPVQIEQVVIQLIRNAIEASEAIIDPPEAVVTLRKLRAGVEIAVEDRGPGIGSSEVDEVFDPFFGEPPIGTAGGFGLPVCLRIVEAHGGELRIEAEDRTGTRVSVFLPQGD